MKYLKEMNVKGKKVLLRVDFNVPVNEKGEITDDTRIKESLTSILFILKEGGFPILMSHRGRPKKKDPQLSLAPCRKRLEELIGRKVTLAPDCIGKETEALAKNLPKDEILLLENLRFHPAEENPELDANFAKSLSLLGALYIDDAFAAAHRAHSSIVTITEYFPEKKGAGFLVEKELSFLNSLLNEPKRPFYALIGGSKVSSKIGVLKALVEKVDGLFIGGGMIYTFLKAQGIEIGDSLQEEIPLESTLKFLKDNSSKIFFPKDQLIASSISPSAQTQLISIQKNFHSPWRGVDIGPETCTFWEAILKDAGTIFWNGPMGIFENPSFAQGTKNLAQSIASFKNANTIIGGGDSVAAIHQLHLEKYFSHLCTGGGASLEYIEQGHLPGLDALS